MGSAKATKVIRQRVVGIKRAYPWSLFEKTPIIDMVNRSIKTDALGSVDGCEANASCPGFETDIADSPSVARLPARALSEEKSGTCSLTSGVSFE